MLIEYYGIEEAKVYFFFCLFVFIETYKLYLTYTLIVLVETLYKEKGQLFKVGEATTYFPYEKYRW